MKSITGISKTGVNAVLLALALRILVYGALLGAIAYGMFWGATVYDEAFFYEFGPLEVLETVLALTAALIFLFAARIDPSNASCSILISGLIFCMFIRESDRFLDILVARHAWKVGVGLVLTSLAIYAIRNFDETQRSVLAFTNLPSFGIFLSSLLVLLGFSRLFGYGPFWEAILDDISFHTVKRVAEESVEQAGYFLLLVSACEYFHAAWSESRRVFQCLEKAV